MKHHPAIMPTPQGCRWPEGVTKQGFTVSCVCGWPGHRHTPHVYETKVAAHLDFGRHLLDPEYGWPKPEEACR